MFDHMKTDSLGKCKCTQTSWDYILLLVVASKIVNPDILDESALKRYQLKSQLLGSDQGS